MWQPTQSTKGTVQKWLLCNYLRRHLQTLLVHRLERVLLILGPLPESCEFKDFEYPSSKQVDVQFLG